MGWPLRMYEPDRIYFVTCRTFQARLLMRPSGDVNQLIGGVLARSVERFGVEVFGFVFLSNHFHLLIRARPGTHAAFMQYLLSNLSKKVGRIVEWKGGFWARRYSAEPVLDDAALIGRLKYILSHGVKERLVDKCADWPGISCLPLLTGVASRAYRWFDWTRRWNKRRTAGADGSLLSDEWAETHVLRVTALPCWQGLSDGTRRAMVERLISDIEARHADSGAQAVGAGVVEQQDPHSRPRRVSKSPRPVAHTSALELLIEFAATYRSFVAAFREASLRWRRGDFDTVFPRFAFRPPLFESAARLH
jgi:REP element-mobilizing transposase RayT